MKRALVVRKTRIPEKKPVKKLLENSIEVTIAPRGRTSDPLGCDPEAFS